MNHYANQLNHAAHKGDNKLDEIRTEFESSTFDYYLDRQRETVNEFYRLNKKVFQCEKLITFLNNPMIEQIDEVVVLGHSMADVDMDYMEVIEKLVNPTKWIISQFNGSPSQTELSKYSFSYKVAFCMIEGILNM